METIEQLKEQLTKLQGRLTKAKEVFRNMESDAKEKDAKIYKALRTSLLGLLLNAPGAPNRKLIVFIYRIAQKFMGFN